MGALANREDHLGAVLRPASRVPRAHSERVAATGQRTDDVARATDGQAHAPRGTALVESPVAYLEPLLVV